jgi:hypothetical protein
MVALTYGDTRVAASATATEAAPKTAARPGFFARFFAALTEARMRQAEREIALYAPHILPLLPLKDENSQRGGL